MGRLVSLGQVGGRMMELSAAETTPPVTQVSPQVLFHPVPQKRNLGPDSRKKRLKTKRCLGRKYNILCSQFSKTWN